MAAVYSHLAHAALSDELGDEYPTDPRLLGKLVADSDNPLWDDTATPEVEDAPVIMQRAWRRPTPISPRRWARTTGPGPGVAST